MPRDAAINLVKPQPRPPRVRPRITRRSSRVDEMGKGAEWYRAQKRDARLARQASPNVYPVVARFMMAEESRIAVRTRKRCRVSGILQGGGVLAVE